MRKTAQNCFANSSNSGLDARLYLRRKRTAPRAPYISACCTAFAKASQDLPDPFPPRSARWKGLLMRNACRSLTGRFQCGCLGRDLFEICVEGGNFAERQLLHAIVVDDLRGACGAGRGNCIVEHVTSQDARNLPPQAVEGVVIGLAVAQSLQQRVSDEPHEVVARRLDHDGEWVHGLAQTGRDGAG